MSATFRKFDAFAALSKTEAEPAKVAKPAKADANFSNFSNFSSGEAQSSSPAQTTLATLATLAAGNAESQRRSAEQFNSRSEPAKVAKPAKADAPAIDEERAAIIEYDAGVPREWAEGFTKLSTMPRPAGIMPKDWQRLIDSAGVFIDKFAAQAASLGWDTASIFGCHPVAPIARLDLAGLVFLIGDGEIIAITARTAKIRTPGGAILTYQRHEPTTGEPQVAAWALA